jgi:hypothetical protein
MSWIIEEGMAMTVATTDVGGTASADFINATINAYNANFDDIHKAIMVEYYELMKLTPEQLTGVYLETEHKSTGGADILSVLQGRGYGGEVTSPADFTTGESHRTDLALGMACLEEVSSDERIYPRHV